MEIGIQDDMVHYTFREDAAPARRSVLRAAGWGDRSAHGPEDGDVC